jgi:hypothetical protein
MTPTSIPVLGTGAVKSCRRRRLHPGGLLRVLGVLQRERQLFAVEPLQLLGVGVVELRRHLDTR